MLISCPSEVMLKILQARLQQYLNRKLLDIQAGFRKGRKTRDRIANICWIIEKTMEFQKNIYFCFIDYAKALTGWTTANCGKFLRKWKYQAILPVPWETCMQVKRQLRHGTKHWFKIGKGIRQGCILSPCLLNLYAEHIIRNARLDEIQVGIKIAGRKYQ